MLDRLQVAKQIEAQAARLFVDTSASHTQARALFAAMAADHVFFQTALSIPASQQLPEWVELLDASHAVGRVNNAYTVIAVDGSQIYPDRHVGAAYYLLNIGSVVLRYGTAQASAQFTSEPMVCIPTEHDGEDAVSIDVINCRRHELELRRSYECALQYATLCLPQEELLVLLDGSYIAWHLQAKDLGLQQRFLPYQLYIYEQLYQQRIPVAGYISMPRSKELVNVLLWYYQTRTDQTVGFDATRLLDTTLAHFFLTTHTRTGMFKNTAPISLQYPSHLRPWFCYVDVGYEMARIEVPQWIVEDAQLLETVIACAVDQSDKGRGFPVCLSEAHEQAVVKGPDRDFFYQCVQRTAVAYGKNIINSQKSMKKRGIEI